MRDAALLLALWVSVPVLAAGAASLRERHEARFPDCVVCRAQKGAQEARKGPPDSLAASR